MVLLLAAGSVVCAFGGVVQLVKGRFASGIAWLVVACAIGPGGWAIWR